jgi:hypothetical protein
VQRMGKARDDTPANGSITGGRWLFHRRSLRRLPQPAETSPGRKSTSRRKPVAGFADGRFVLLIRHPPNRADCRHFLPALCTVENAPISGVALTY